MEKITAEHPLSQSPDFVKENIETLKQLFPTIVKEGKIDLLELQALLGQEVENEEEYYRFTWAGKSMARREANKPSTGTLRPDKESSKDWDTTQNIFIEGDNLEVLKLLQKSYANRVKMIYIDPPYNTGKDFVYKDNYTDNLSNYLKITGQLDEAGKRKNTNTESDGRYHSNWLSMMYPRLKLARNLLADDGVIFISIDDNEVGNLRKLGDEIFGEDNFIGNIIWRGGRRNAAKVISTSHEYMLGFAKDLAYCLKNNIFWRERKRGIDEVYKKAETILKSAKNYEEASQSLKEWFKNLPEDNPANDISHYNWIDRNGVYFAADISRGGGGGPMWQIKNPFTSEIVSTPERGWAYSKLEDLESDIKLELIHFNGSNVPCKKSYLKDNEYQLVDTVFYKDRRGSSKRLRKLMDGDIFDFPKDETVLEEKINSFSDENSLVLDFFAGSGTTAHAVMKRNSVDGGKRKFICVQLPESTTDDSEAYNAGYKTVAQITKERIRRAGEKVKNELNTDLFTKGGEVLDIGFKAFKLDSSNIVGWDGSPENLDKNLLNAEKNIKDSRTAEDVLYEILLKHGLDLALPIEQKDIAGKTVFNIGLGTLFICLDDAVTTKVAEGIGKWKQELEPATCKVIFKDTGLTDVEKTNGMQILKRYGIEEVNTI